MHTALDVITCLIIGPIGIAIGAAVIRFRSQFIRAAIDMNTRLYGQKTGERTRKTQAPRLIIFDGVWFILIGAGFLIGGLSNLPLLAD